MRRRKFITLLGGAAVAWPPLARAQQGGQSRRVGVLLGLGENDPEGQSWLDGFRQGLEKLGLLQGSNVVMDYRYAPGNSAEEVLALAKEMMTLRPDVILASGTSIVAEFRTSDPHHSDCIGCRLRPEFGRDLSRAWRGRGAISLGCSNTRPLFTGKWLSLLKEITPNLARAAPHGQPERRGLQALSACRRCNGFLTWD